MKFRSAHLFIILSISFLLYSFSIYLKPFGIKREIKFDIKKASEGRIVWQKNNCQSCHQLYGLGGYLGPDLTNVISNPKKGEIIINQMVKYGVRQMPAYNLSEYDLKCLIEFLKSTDATGSADPRNYLTTYTGMIEQK